MKNLRSNLVALSTLVALLLFSTGASANDMCFQPPKSVAGLPGTPGWMSGMGTVRTDLNEPRWSAPLTDFSSDLPGKEGSYRILKSSDGTKLFVQVQTSADVNAPGNNDRVFFGISKDDTGSNPRAFGLRFTIGSGVPATNPETTTGSLQLRSYNFDNTRSAGSRWTSTNGKPSWIKNPALWSKSPVVPAGGDVDWAVAFVVDLGSLPTPITKADTFKLMIGLHTNGTILGEPTIIKAYTPTPPTTFPSSASNPFAEDFSTLKWQKAVPTETGCLNGITISKSQISVVNSVDASTTNVVALNAGAVNTFHATPDFNGIGVANGGILAEFRIANWGTVWAEAPWTPVKNSGGMADKVPNSGNAFHFACDPNAGGSVCGISPAPSGHQCVFVRMNYGPGYSYQNAPITKATEFRNMTFRNLSRDVSSAQIDPRGIKTKGNKAEIFLYVYQRNMPAHGASKISLPRHAMAKTRAHFFAPPPTPPKSSGTKASFAQVQKLLRAQRAKIARRAKTEKGRLLKFTAKDAAAARLIPTQVSAEDEMKEVWPHIEVHPYYQEGPAEKIKGVAHRHMVPMYPFSAYYDHKEAHYGFTQKFALKGGQFKEIRAPKDGEPGLYKLLIPKNRIAQLVITTEAHEKPLSPSGITGTGSAGGETTSSGGSTGTNPGQCAEDCVKAEPICTYSVLGSRSPGGMALLLILLSTAGAFIRRRRQSA